MSQCFFDYGKTELDFICAQDSALAAVIKTVGKIERKLNPDVFSALIRSIASQQISNSAAATIISRLQSLLGAELLPSNIMTTDDVRLRACGLSTRKINYIKGVAQSSINQQIDFSSLSQYDNETIISKLTSLAGVGRWTAEMILIFSLNRKDVISYNDFGIRKGLQIINNLTVLSKKDFDLLTAKYHPYATIASFYLWHIANNT